MTSYSHFGLAIPPFTSTPDPGFFFQSRDCTNIVASLDFAIRRDFGIVTLVGDDGTGKTTLGRLLLDSLARSGVSVAMLDARAAGRIIAACRDGFGLTGPGEISDVDALQAMTTFLQSQHHFNRPVVVIIDEAQHLEPEDLRALKTLERLEQDKKKLLHIVLIGNARLDDVLRRPEAADLSQRVVFSLTTKPLADAEARRYLLHRLNMARLPEALDSAIFSEAALDLLIRWSGGVPHLLNQLAERSMDVGAAHGSRMVQVAHVQEARKDFPALRRHQPRARLLRSSLKRVRLAFSRPAWLRSGAWGRRRLLWVGGGFAVVIVSVASVWAIGHMRSFQSHKPNEAYTASGPVGPSVEVTSPPAQEKVNLPPTPPEQAAPVVTAPVVPTPPLFEVKPPMAKDDEVGHKVEKTSGEKKSAREETSARQKKSGSDKARQEKGGHGGNESGAPSANGGSKSPVVVPAVSASPVAPPPSAPASSSGVVSPDDDAPPPPVSPVKSSGDVDAVDALRVGAGHYPGSHK